MNNMEEIQLSTISRKVRLSNIEILRIFSIFLVILHHIAIHTNWSSGLSTNFELVKDAMIIGGKIGVDLFVIISGYLIINSKLKTNSITRILSETLVFSLVMYFVVIALKINGTIFATDVFLKRLFPVIFSEYWLVTAYILMYIFLPILLPFLINRSKKAYQKFLIVGFVVVCVWPMINLNKGMNFSYVILFLYLFAIGGYIRKFAVKLNKFFLLLLIIVLLSFSILLTHIVSLILNESNNPFYNIFSIIGWTQPNSWRENTIIWFDASPFPLLIACCLFLLAISVKSFYNNSINIMGKHVFGAYLFQSAPIFSPWIYASFINANKINGTLNRFIYAVVTAIVILIVGIAMHIILDPLAKTINSFLLKLIRNVLTSIELFSESKTQLFKRISLTVIKILLCIATAIYAVPENKFLAVCIISCILFLIMRKFTFKNNSIINWITGFLGAILFIISLSTKHYGINHIFLMIIAIVTFTCTNVSILTKISEKSFIVNEYKSKNIFLKYVGLYGLVTSIYFIAYYPGVLIIDSVNQWNQVHSNYPWNNWHPIGHTFLIWLTSSIWNNPASFILLQSSIFVLVFAYFAMLLKTQLTSKWISDMFFACTAIVPFFPLQSMIVVKDTMFTYAFIFFVLALVQIIKSNGQYIKNPLLFISVLISVLGICLWRSNGFPIILVMAIMISVAFGIKNYWRLILIMLVSVMTYFVINGPVASYFHIFQPSKTEAYGMLIQIDAGIMHGNGTINNNQKQYFNELFPHQMVAAYRPGDVDAVKFDRRFNNNLLTNDTDRFKKESIKLILSNKKLALSTYLAQTKVVWNQNVLYRNGTFMRDKYMPIPIGYFLTVRDIEKYHIKYHSFNYDFYKNGNKTLHRILRNWQNMFIQKSVQHWFLPGIYLMIQLMFTFWFVLQKEWYKVLLMLPIIGLSGTYMLAIPAPDIRYVQPILLYIFIIPLINALTDNVKMLPYLNKFYNRNDKFKK